MSAIREGKVCHLELKCSAGHALSVSLANLSVETEGGCYGHEGQYCYCPSIEVWVNFGCHYCFPGQVPVPFQEKAKLSS